MTGGGGGSGRTGGSLKGFRSSKYLGMKRWRATSHFYAIEFIWNVIGRLSRSLRSDKRQSGANVRLSHETQGFGILTFTFAAARKTPTSATCRSPTCWSCALSSYVFPTAAGSATLHLRR